LILRCVVQFASSQMQSVGVPLSHVGDMGTMVVRLSARPIEVAGNALRLCFVMHENSIEHDRCDLA
jgi:hypothetical protein